MKVSIASLMCFLGLTVFATAQESTYSANSLMVAFDKGANVKGAQITFRDVVVDNKNSRVTFRSSETNRVICELNPVSANHSKPPAVGSIATVIGKVRGRGLLGNVTLDNCSVAVPEEAAVAAPIAAQPEPQEVAPTAPEGIISEAAPATIALGNELPQPQEPAKSIATPAKAKTATPRKEIAAAAPAPRLALMEEPPQSGSIPKPAIPYRLYALLILAGAIGSLMLSWLFTSVRSVKFWRSPGSYNTPEIRQAALQALLLKESKKR
jgi:hypothetical protein